MWAVAIVLIAVIVFILRRLAPLVTRLRSVTDTAVELDLSIKDRAPIRE